MLHPVFEDSLQSKFGIFFLKKLSESIENNLREWVTTPAGDCSEDSWAEITGRVQSKSSVDSKSCSHGKNNQTNQKWCHVRANTNVFGIQQRKDSTDKQSCSKNLRQQSYNKCPHLRT